MGKQKNQTDYPNRTTISVTEMVVYNRDRWVNRNKTSYLLPTLLPNLFTYRLQVLIKLLQNTPRELLVGVYKYQKNVREE